MSTRNATGLLRLVPGRAGSWDHLAIVVLLLSLNAPVASLAATSSEGSADSLIEGSTETDYTVDFWRTQQGLPSDTVNALLQTRDGYIWVGTSAGLVRFDGFEFNPIPHPAPIALQEVWITALLEDSEGTIWVGTMNQGVYRLNDERCDHFVVEDDLASDSVTSFAQDADGQVWIGTQSGLNVWRKGRLERFMSDTALDHEPIVALHAGRSGVVWITTRFGVYREQGGKAVPFEFEEMPQGRNADFVGVYEDRQGNLWTYGATFLLNLNQGKRFNYFRSLDPLTSRVWTICEQAEGGLWIGTSGRGLFRFRNGRFDVAGARHGLDQCDVRALNADAEGNLWIGTSGSGLARLRVQRWRVISWPDGTTVGRSTALTLDREGRLVVGNTDGGIFRLTDQRLEPIRVGPPLQFATHIQSLCIDREGSIWAATLGMGLFELSPEGRQRQFTTADGLDDDFVLAVTFDPGSNAVWAGTRSGGLFRINRDGLERWPAEGHLESQPIRCLYSGSGDDLLVGQERGGLFQRTADGLRRVIGPSSLAQATVRWLDQDQSGRLWVGTEGAGAFCRSEGRWTPVGKAEGLVADAVLQIVQDVEGNYWFGTDSGLLQISRAQISNLIQGESGSITPLMFHRDALAEGYENQLGWPSALVAPDGRIWFAIDGGLLAVDANQVPVMAHPSVLIEKVEVDGQTVYQPIYQRDSPELRVEPGSSSLDIDYTAISFARPGEIKFRHMLEGFDADWVDDGAARRAHYGPIPPGKYHFRVMAATSEGVWTEARKPLPLVFIPPFWQSWLFIVSSGLISVAAFWSLVRYVSLRRLHVRLQESEQLHAMERERTRIAQDMHDEIGSKLTRISFLSEAARNAGASLTAVGPQVSAIAKTTRELLHALDEIVWAVNPRNDNLEHLAGYLEQYAREYFQDTPVDSIISVPHQLPRIPLKAEIRHNVFLAFKESLSNVLRHSGCPCVWVTMKSNGNTFEVEVRDEGAGFQPPEQDTPGHDGLRNMVERLRLVNGSCIICSEPGRGTTVQLRFSLTNQHPERRPASIP